MRIVVFSDSHRSFAALQRIMRQQSGADAYLHLGDGEQELTELQQLYPDKLIRGVRGNCDWGSQGNLWDILTCDGKKIFYTHGHLFDVKSGLAKLKYHARVIEADIVLFGHTHKAFTDYDDGLYLLNPGSCNLNGRDPSYGIVDITEAGIVTNVIPL